MLFNSGVFLFLFLPFALLGYQLVARFGRRPSIGWLVLSSLIFYAWWNWHFLLVLAASILGNHLLASRIATSRAETGRQRWMIVGIALNLAALGYFKYLFPLLNALHDAGLGTHAWQNIALPLGISFFTFTQIGYLVDLAQAQAEPQSLLEYALFVTYFPHLIAGPIIHHKEMMPQFNAGHDRRLKSHDMLIGFSWFILGLAKKCIVADYFAILAGLFFDHPTPLGLLPSWVGLCAYSLELYFDFSGYSDMAIGLARIFSIDFPLNFNSPYKARNIIDFWQRWHITLTRYLTLYLYNPIALSVNRRRLRAGKKVSQKAARTPGGFAAMIAFPTIVTMVLVGIWHGAGWQFLVFGLLHGIYLTVNHAWRLYRGHTPAAQAEKPLRNLAALLLTYLCVLIGQLFFHVHSVREGLHDLAGLCGIHGVGHLHAINIGYRDCLLLVGGYLLVWLMPNTQQILAQAGDRIKEERLRWLSWKPTAGWTLALALLAIAALLSIARSSTFLYFQF